MALTTVPASLSATAITLTTAAQPNITSVGTLTGLTVSGNIAGTLTTAAQTNITSVGTLTGLALTGNVTITKEGPTLLLTDSSSSRTLLNFVDDNNSVLRASGPLLLQSGGSISALTLDASQNATFAGNLDLADDKIIRLGAGNDLQIYHTTTGNNSVIAESGSGSLRILATDLQLRNSADNGYYAHFANGGAATLYHNGSAKLATATGGVSITGDLDASNSILVGTNNSYFAENVIRFKPSGAAYFDHNTTGQHIYFRTSVSSTLDTTVMQVGGDGYVYIRGLRLSGADGSVNQIWQSTSNAMLGLAANGGDINFGQTSASTMRLKPSGNVGIGTTGPQKRLHIRDDTQTNQSVRFGNESAAPYGEINYNSTGLEHLYIDSHGTTTGYGNIAFRTGPTPDTAMFIDAVGRVGIGDTTPRARLEVVGGANEGIILKPNGQITYTPTSSNFYNGLTFENAGSAHAFSIAYGQGGWLKFSYFDNASTYEELAHIRPGGNFYPAGSVVMASGEGINFSATANTSASGATMSSELLDDYEEGTWTPGIGGSSGGACTMGSGNLGRYVKVGAKVTLNGTVHIASVPTLSGSIILTGLPFPSRAQYHYRSNAAPVTNTAITPGTNMTMLGIGVDQNLSYAWIVGMNPSTKTYTHNPTVGTGYLYGFSMTYFTNS